MTPGGRKAGRRPAGAPLAEKAETEASMALIRKRLRWRGGAAEEVEER
jgi:hypothetical protein